MSASASSGWARSSAARSSPRPAADTICDTRSLPITGPSASERRSATISPRVAARLRATASASTCSPATSRAAVPVAPRARRSSSRRVGHSACHAPSGRSSTASAAARCRVAPSCGARSAAERMSTDAAGFCFCGMADEPPPTPSDELADLGAAERRDVGGDDADRVDRLHERIAQFGDRPAGGVPGRVGGGQVQLGRERGGQFGRGIRSEQLDERGERSAGAAQLCGQGVGGGIHSLDRPLHPAQPVRRAQPDRGGHGVLGEGAGRGDLVAVRAGELPQRGRRLVQRRRDLARRAGGDEHERRVQDVLARGSPVHFRLGAHRVVQQADQRDHRVASGDGCRSQRRRIDRVPAARLSRAGPSEGAGDAIDDIGRTQSQRAARADEGHFGGDERIQHSGVGHRRVEADRHRRQQADIDGGPVSRQGTRSPSRPAVGSRSGVRRRACALR